MTTSLVHVPTDTRAVLGPPPVLRHPAHDLDLDRAEAAFDRAQSALLDAENAYMATDADNRHALILANSAKRQAEYKEWETSAALRTLRETTAVPLFGRAGPANSELAASYFVATMIAQDHRYVASTDRRHALWHRQVNDQWILLPGGAITSTVMAKVNVLYEEFQDGNLANVEAALALAGIPMVFADSLFRGMLSRRSRALESGIIGASDLLRVDAPSPGSSSRVIEFSDSIIQLSGEGYTSRAALLQQFEDLAGCPLTEPEKAALFAAAKDRFGETRPRVNGVRERGFPGTISSNVILGEVVDHARS